MQIYNQDNINCKCKTFCYKRYIF